MSKLVLTIELVPASSWFSNVRSAVSKKEWDYIRRIVYDRAWHICEICGGVGEQHPVECHEIWRYDDKNLIQKLENMIALCPDCHRVKHYGLSKVTGTDARALKHFMKVNKISEEKALKYIKKAFIIWGERSSKKWKLDISVLKSFNINIEKIND